MDKAIDAATSMDGGKFKLIPWFKVNAYVLRACAVLEKASDTRPQGETSKSQAAQQAEEEAREKERKARLEVIILLFAHPGRSRRAATLSPGLICGIWKKEIVCRFRGGAGELKGKGDRIKHRRRTSWSLNGSMHSEQQVARFEGVGVGVEAATVQQIEEENTLLINDLYRLLKKYANLRLVVHTLHLSYRSARMYPIFPRYNMLKDMIKDVLRDPSYMEVCHEES
ncbi:uncharacterized protein CDAR_512121 [Caerostris darwini]|uniref:Uncharacterized protein n=1 Tax=Caerostris darwini TaxID=1538125 RepID=A0AAV4WK44_9ARAC|nr:uncharacterized protein CDAR_512121 [Caerostris darwini]